MLADDIVARLGAAGWVAVDFRPRWDGNALEVPLASAADLPRAAAVLAEAGAVLTTMVGTDERPRDGRFRLYYAFSLPGSDRFLVLVAALSPETPAFPSVTRVLPAAHWYEREVRDLLGLLPEGHPDPRPLVLHEGWPEGLYPLRKDFPADHRPPQVPGEFAFQRVEGEGVMEIPVGPIHAGIIEPGHFRFSALGETIIHLEARLFYTHRGVEKEAEGLDPDRGLLLAERICGQCAFSHAVAYAQAVERLAGAEVPARARYVRTLGLELERLANHLGDVGNLCAGTGFAHGTMTGARLREAVLRLNEAVAGNRFLRGLNAVGGVRRDVGPELRARIRATLAAVEGEFAELGARLLALPSFLDRVQGTGRLGRDAARDLGVVGVAARASGLDVDMRRDHPHAAYGELDFRVPVYPEGDVLARLRVRMDEARESFGLVAQVLDALDRLPPEGALRAPVGDLPPYRAALGYTESPRGGNVHWVMAGPDNRLYRYRVRSASYPNWPAVPFAVQGNIVPDFPLVNKSFELCYACLDR